MTTKLERTIKKHRRASDILCLPNAQCIADKAGATLYDVVWEWDNSTTFNKPFKLPDGTLVDVYVFIELVLNIEWKEGNE